MTKLIIDKNIPISEESFEGQNIDFDFLPFDNQESGATLEPVQLSDAHNQYQFLSDESSKKILVSHRISHFFFQL